MKYLPFENIIYKTRLSSEKVIERIQNNIEPKKLFRLTVPFGNGNHKPYEGTIERNTFNITRIIRYRNSFLPRIKGEIERDLNGTKITVKMRLHIFVSVFMLVWCCGVGFGLITFFSSSLVNGSLDPDIFIPVGMLVFGYALTMIGFKYESIKSKKYLAQLFEAEIENN